jgi:hypothetical protein
VGSRNLAHFDAALVGYTFAVLFATFAITYRYSMWLQRPPTALFLKRGWQVFFRRKYLAGNIAHWFARVPAEFGANLFILRRDRFRWGAHMLIMWGCIAAVGITFPLVFGWVHFETLPGRFELVSSLSFWFSDVCLSHSFVVRVSDFHGLVWASIPVTAE